MEITTKLPAPSSQLHKMKAIIPTLAFKIIIIIFSLLFSHCLHNEHEQDILEKEGLLSSLSSCVRKGIGLNDLLEWVGKKLSSFVAASLTYHIGFCCLFVGLVHLKWISPK